jgi:hypothetical protein
MLNFIAVIIITVVSGILATGAQAQAIVAGSTPGSFRVTETGALEYLWREPPGRDATRAKEPAHAGVHLPERAAPGHQRWIRAVGSHMVIDRKDCG